MVTRLYQVYNEKYFKNEKRLFWMNDGKRQVDHMTYTRVVFIHVPIPTSALSCPILSDVDGR